MPQTERPLNAENLPPLGLKPEPSIWERLGTWLLNGQVAWIALCLTLLMTISVWKNTQEALVQAQRVRFENRAAEVTNAVLKRLQGYEHVLRGGVGLFAASESVTRSEWRDQYSFGYWFDPDDVSAICKSEIR